MTNSEKEMGEEDLREQIYHKMSNDKKRGITACLQGDSETNHDFSILQAP